MTISYKWLKDYIDTNATPEELADLLTFSGLEIEDVEKVETIKGGLEHVVIAKVVTCEPHPNSDHLHLTTVDAGGEQLLNIVCGAPNVAAGQKVVCATIGTKIWTSDTEYFEIKKSKIRGHVSEGMLCSEVELQLGQAGDGIMVLPDDAPVGMAAKDYFHVEDDYILEVAITANRSDATSHIGVARDLVAVMNTRNRAGLAIKWPEVATNIPLTTDVATAAVPVSIANDKLCPRYSSLLIEGIEVKESPDWLQNKLRTVGIRPINNVVDITNFVLMEVGQPLHAFDADMITGGRVEVKCMPQDTPFITLDGQERKLDARDLMICNAEEPMCIAGVFGGEKSGVTANTKRVFIESAYFDPVSIRKTSRRHGLKTDASFRYERGCDPNITLWAIRRAAHLITQLAGGKVGTILDIYPKPIERAKVELNFQRVTNLIGKEIPKDDIRTALTSLDIEIASEDADGMLLLIPTCKVDVYRECDVVEEIMRIYGYNNITFDERLNSCLSHGSKPNHRKVQSTIASFLASNGFSEIMNNSLTKSAYYEGNEDFDLSRCIAIINPLSKELNVMRQTLLYSGLECIAYNLKHKIQNQRLFEFGRAYMRLSPAASGNVDAQPQATAQQPLKVTDKYSEVQHLSLFMTGNTAPENWKIKATATDFFDLKGYVYNILRRLRVDIDRLVEQPSTYKYFSQGLTLTFKDSGKELLSLGKLSQAVLNLTDCKQEVYYADINWDLLLKSMPRQEVTYTEVNKFPEVKRDLSLIIDSNVTFAELKKVAFATEKKLLKQVTLFDVYEGKGIAEGKKSYALSFILQDKDKTLTDKQIDSVMQKLQKSFETQLGAKVRQ